jgi:hypothetical protein
LERERWTEKKRAGREIMRGESEFERGRWTERVGRGRE